MTPNLFTYFRIFYGYAGKALFALFFLFLLTGITESIGIAMLLPVLEYAQGGARAPNTYAEAVYTVIRSLGVDVTLLSLLAFMLAVFFFKGVLTLVQSGYAAYIRNQLVQKLKLRLCQSYAEMKYSFFTDTHIGHLSNAATVEAETAVGAFSKFIEMLAQVVMISIYIGSTLLINWRVTSLVVCICAVLFFALRYLARIARRISIKISENNSQIQSYLLQSVYNFKYLKATDAFNRLYRFLFEQIHQNTRLRIKNELLVAVPSSFLEAAVVFFLAGLIYYYVVLADQSITSIVVILAFFYKAFGKIFALNIYWQKFNSNIGGVEVVRKLLDDLERHREVSQGRQPVRFHESIEFEDVSFRYGDRRVLKHINLKIPKDCTVGLVGRSGAGKTTVFDLLTGLIVPQSGAIKIDGVDYRRLDIAAWRRMIGYVTQEPVTFNSTIADNITLFEGAGAVQARNDRIQAAAQHAYCRGFVESLADGYQTMIGDKGVKLSGGQRQRIAIARELYKKPQIIIFDEATSSLDTESEAFIQNSIDAMIGSRTILIIAHRLATIRKCDIVYVIDQGRIVESGSYDALYGKRDSLFHRMCKAQQL